MFRFPVLLFLALIFGITAKPYKPSNQFVQEVLQDTVISKGLKGQMSSRVEVEPPEDMQETDYNISPNMKLWSLMGQGKQDLKAGEEFVYPKDPNMIKVDIKTPGTIPVAEMQTDQSQDANRKYNQQPEEDKDDIDHPAFTEENEPEEDIDEVYHEQMEELQRYLVPLMADKAGAGVYLPQYEPEEDEDKLYHGDDQPSPVQKLVGLKIRGENIVRVHLQPEEDMDDLYHKDVPLPISYHGDAELVVSAEVPSERRHSEPEEDLDDLYHKDVPLPISYHGDAELVVSAEVPSERRHSEPEEDLDDLYHR